MTTQHSANFAESMATLKDFSVQVVLITREMGLVSLAQLAYDGTKTRLATITIAHIPLLNYKNFNKN